MRKLTQIALGLTLGVTGGITVATTPLLAQSGMKPVPVPGPYQIIIRQQPVMPTFTPQRYVMPMPYWMQNTQQQPRAQTSGPQTTQAPAAVGRTEPQPLTSGWNAAPQAQPQQGYGTTPAPGYFPGYAPGNTQTPARPSQPAPNYANPNTPPAPWGQQGFMPMQAPWQNGWNQNGGGQNGWNQNGWGQNGWNNNWNNSGYGNRQGFAAPMMPRQ